MCPVGVNNEALGQVAVFGYDGTNYRVIKIDNTGQLYLATAFPTTIEVTQSDDTLLKATVGVKAGQTIAVTQDTFANLKATANTIPRMPASVTDLTVSRQATINDASFVEAFSGTNATSFAALSGRTIANGKRVCLACVFSGVGSTAGFVYIAVGYDSTYLVLLPGPSPLAAFNPSILLYLVGDGSKVFKVATQNRTGGSAYTVVTAQMFEEDVF